MCTGNYGRGLYDFVSLNLLQLSRTLPGCTVGVTSNTNVT